VSSPELPCAPSEAAQAWRILEQAELICSADAVEQAVVGLAARITQRFASSFPVVLCVMNGGVFFCARLLTRLHFPLSLDYVHASRYGAGLTGKEVAWRMVPQQIVRGREVIIVDDILDAGQTLLAIRDKVLACGAASVTLAVLAEKTLGQPKPVVADYVGLSLPNRFVFGCGLDVAGFWRNLPAIYALREG
jgi:hypoxanthine phosphoribosyltransferase